MDVAGPEIPKGYNMDRTVYRKHPANIVLRLKRSGKEQNQRESKGGPLHRGDHLHVSSPYPVEPRKTESTSARRLERRAAPSWE
jgi:hypothetical protein